jgi:AMP-binding enzyme
MTILICKGGTVALVNGAYNENELQYHLQEADATVLFCHEDNLTIALKAADKARISRNRILLFGDKAVNGIRPYTTVLVGNRRAKHIKYSAEEAKTATAYLPFSSGTTGRVYLSFPVYKKIISTAFTKNFHHGRYCKRCHVNVSATFYKLVSRLVIEISCVLFS